VLCPDEVSLASNHFCDRETRREKKTIKTSRAKERVLSMYPQLEGQVQAQGAVLST